MNATFHSSHCAYSSNSRPSACAASFHFIALHLCKYIMKDDAITHHFNAATSYKYTVAYSTDNYFYLHHILFYAYPQTHISILLADSSRCIERGTLLLPLIACSLCWFFFCCCCCCCCSRRRRVLLASLITSSSSSPPPSLNYYFIIVIIRIYLLLSHGDGVAMATTRVDCCCCCCSLFLVPCSVTVWPIDRGKANCSSDSLSQLMLAGAVYMSSSSSDRLY